MANSEFLWDPEIEPFFLGSVPNHALEVVGGIPTINTVMTGIGARVSNSNFTTLRIEYAEIQNDGTLGPKKYSNFGSAPDHALEKFVTTDNVNDVVVGFAVRVSDNNVSSLRIYTRTMNTDTGTLSTTLNTVTDGDAKFEIDWVISDNSDVGIMTTLGLRASNNNATTAYTTVGDLISADSV